MCRLGALCPQYFQICKKVGQEGSHAARAIVGQLVKTPPPPIKGVSSHQWGEGENVKVMHFMRKSEFVS